MRMSLANKYGALTPQAPNLLAATQHSA